MKRFLILLLLFVSSFTFAQNITVDQPRMRVNKTSSLVLDNTWKTIEFDGTSTDNVNTFGLNPANGNPMVWWDQTNKLFRIYGDYQSHYVLQIFPTTTTTAISVRAILQWRIVIPNGNGPGVDRYLPYSDTAGYGDMKEVTILTAAQVHDPEMFVLTATPAIRTNGFYIQFRLSNLITLGTCTLNNCSANIQSLK